MTGKKIYTTKAMNIGGRDGESYLLDADFRIPIATPKRMGGTGEGRNPEELFALGFGACFNSALGLVKDQAGINAPSNIETEVSLHNDPTEGFSISVVIRPSIEGLSLEEVQALGEKAHQVCPYSKATRGNIEVVIEAAEYHA